MDIQSVIFFYLYGVKCFEYNENGDENENIICE